MKNTHLTRLQNLREEQVDKVAFWAIDLAITYFIGGGSDAMQQSLNYLKKYLAADDVANERIQLRQTIKDAQARLAELEAT